MHYLPCKESYRIRSFNLTLLPADPGLTKCLAASKVGPLHNNLMTTYGIFEYHMACVIWHESGRRASRMLRLMPEQEEMLRMILEAIFEPTFSSAGAHSTTVSAEGSPAGQVI